MKKNPSPEHQLLSQSKYFELKYWSTKDGAALLGGAIAFIITISCFYGFFRNADAVETRIFAIFFLMPATMLAIPFKIARNGFIQRDIWVSMARIYLKAFSAAYLVCAFISLNWWFIDPNQERMEPLFVACLFSSYIMQVITKAFDGLIGNLDKMEKETSDS